MDKRLVLLGLCIILMIPIVYAGPCTIYGYVYDTLGNTAPSGTAVNVTSTTGAGGSNATYTVYTEAIVPLPGYYTSDTGDACVVSTSYAWVKSFNATHTGYNESLISPTNQLQLNIYMNQTEVADTTPPNISLDFGTLNRTYLLNDTVIVNATVTDDTDVDAVWINITTPNSTIIIELVNNTVGDIYEYLYSDLEQRGRYNITVYANDTNGNLASVDAYIDRIPYNVIDVLNTRDIFLNYSVEILVNNSGFLDLNVTFNDSKVLSGIVVNFSEDSTRSILRIFDEGEESTNPHTVHYAINPESLSASFINLTFNATGEDLYKCKEYNFTSHECYGNWSYFMDITIGVLYTITIGPDDPGFIETVPGIDVSLAPIDNERLVAGFVDSSATEVAFVIIGTNGTTLVSRTVVDSNSDGSSRVSVAMINSTHFAIAWIDGPNHDLKHAIYTTTGSQVMAPTTITADLGPANDVSVVELGDRYVICSMNSNTNDVDFTIFSNTGSAITGEVTVDSNAAPNQAANNLVECAAANESVFFVLWFDDSAFDDIHHQSYDSNGNLLSGINIDHDDNAGVDGQAAIAGLDKDRVVSLWFNDNYDNVQFDITAADGTLITDNQTIDSNAGIRSRIAITSVRDIDATDDYFVAFWHDVDAGNLKAAVYNNTGGTVTAPFVIEPNPNSTFLLLDIAARDHITGDSICPGTFATAYTNATGSLVLNTFYINGTAWNGTCFIPDTRSPNVDLNYPIPNFNTTNSTIIFNWTATDNQDSNLTCNLTIDGTVNASNIDSLNNTPKTQTVPGFADGTYLWNVTCWDDAGNTNTSETRTFTIDTTPPTVTLIRPPPYYINDTESPITVNFTCNAADNIGLTNISLYLTDNLNQSFSLNQTSAASGTNFNKTWIIQLGTGNYTWNCLAYDEFGFYDWADVNRSITANYTAMGDITPPNVTLVSPAAGYYDDSDASVQVNFTCNATDNVNLKNISLYLTNALNQSLSFNQTSTASGTVDSSTWIIELGIGNYTWNCLAYDNSSNSGWGINRSLKINFTNFPPTAPIVNVTPKNPATSQDILCNITQISTDANNDTITYYFEWYKDSLLFLTFGPTASTSHILSSGYTAKDQEWNCSVTPYDGTVNGTINWDNATVINSPPTSSTIPDQSWETNTNNTDAFDLDSYFSDADNDTLNYTYTQPDNITISVDGNNSVTFIPDTDFYGTRYIIFYANDSVNTTQSNNITLHVYTCGDGTCDTAESCSSCPTDCGACTAPTGGGGGGGGGGAEKPKEEPIVILEEPEVIRFIPPIIFPAPKKVKDIGLTIISYPEKIMLDEEGFVIFAKVENSGDIPLGEIVVDIETSKGWVGKSVHLGGLDVGENKILEISFDNIICPADNFVIFDLLELKLTASEEGASESKELSISIEIPELSVLTDRKYYSEDDIMRVCMIFNNLQGEYKDQLEFELGILDELYGEYYIIDYLSPYYVNKNKLLVVTKDYKLDDIPATNDYTIRAALYQKGELFSDTYMITDAETSRFLNGFVEDRILQGENTVYTFTYGNERHSIMINEFDDDFVGIRVSSYSSDYVIRLLETIHVDLDNDNITDISITYLGEEDGKADLRLRLIPKQPLTLGRGSWFEILDIGEIGSELRKPTRVGISGTSLTLLVLTVLFVLILLVSMILKAGFYYVPIFHDRAIRFRNKLRRSLDLKKCNKYEEKGKR